MTRPGIRRRALTSVGVALAVLAGALASTPPAAAADVVGLTVLTTRDSQAQVEVCLGSAVVLPAHVTLAYTVTASGALVASGEWSAGQPTSTVLAAQRCPARLTVLALTGLTASTPYVVTAVLTASPRVEDDDGVYIVDDARSEIVGTASTTLTTAAAPVDDEATGDSGASSPAAPGPSPSQGGPPSAVPAASGDEPLGGAPLLPGDPDSAVVITDPATFGSDDMAQLTPADVALIPPSVLRLLQPRVVDGMTRPQLRALSPRQFGALRIAALARLSAGQWSALPASSVRGLRVSTVRSLPSSVLRRIPPRTLHSLRPAQLRSLTARQVSMLTPPQVRGLSPRQATWLGLG